MEGNSVNPHTDPGKSKIIAERIFWTVFCQAAGDAKRSLAIGDLPPGQAQPPGYLMNMGIQRHPQAGRGAELRPGPGGDFIFSDHPAQPHGQTFTS